MNSSVETFQRLSHDYSRQVTKSYSTSFSLAIRLLAPSLRQDIYNIYGFVRVADEIVDSFYTFSNEELLNRFEDDLYHAIKNKISLNPTLNSFQRTVHKYEIGHDLIEAFMKSMRRDLTLQACDQYDYKEYIYGSADVVGLMCLRVFVNGNDKDFESLRESAMNLGSAFQKVNFLRDIKDDKELLNRVYFPGIDPHRLTEKDKQAIIHDIKMDFSKALNGIYRLPATSGFGVYIAYRYYMKLLHKLEFSAPGDLMKRRVRIPNFRKLLLLVTSYFRYKFYPQEKLA